MTAPQTITIVDDDQEICRLLANYLGEQGFRAVTAPDGRALDRVLAREPVSLIVLDLMLPGEDGLSICRRLRAVCEIPIIMLTAKGETPERITGLDTGADDYMSKPFDPRELVSRIHRVLQRAQPDKTGKRTPVYRFSGWKLDPAGRQLCDARGRNLAISPGELELLRLFLENPRRVLSRDTILRHTRGIDYNPYNRGVDIQVSRLRKTLGDTSPPTLIKTVRGKGYIFTGQVKRQ